MSALTFAVRGAIASLGVAERATLLERATSTDDTIHDRTAHVISRVRREGDVALRAFALEFDHVRLDTLEVPRSEWRAALASLDTPLRRALERATANIHAVHGAFRPIAREVTTPDGVLIGRRPDPLRSVGVYAPGGRATYPSSLLMGAVPARVAGVEEVIVCSPPNPDGLPSRVLLAAAELADADRVFAVGGAGAVAAMAFGTASVPRVDRIVGPGNAYVAEAKLQVAGVCSIDSPAGPSELLIIADGTADAAVVAREMIAQAEHDPLASVVLVSTSQDLDERVGQSITRLAMGAPRFTIIRDALAARGALLFAASIDEAVAFATSFAPEHALICCRDAEQVTSRLRSAGTIFVGSSSSVSFGDYMSGANHVLPTGGLARSYSGLSTLDFYRWTTTQRIDRTAAAALAEDAGMFADAEGLPGHAAAARQWKETD